MDIVLNNDDLAFLDVQIKKMPFEFGHPLFQFFTAKIQQVKDAQKTTDELITSGPSESKVEDASVPKKKALVKA